MKEIKQYKVKALPNQRVPDSVFYVKPDGSDIVRTYITDLDGNPIPLKDFLGASISNTDGNLTITGADDKVINLSPSFLASLISAGDNISIFSNDSGYITLADVPAGKFTADIEVKLSGGKTLGKYLNGQTIPSTGLTFEQFANLIAQEVSYPTFTPVTFSIALSNNSLQEVGSTYSATLTGNFNRGLIKGNLVGGIWDETAPQNPRAGASTNYTLDGTTQVGNSLVVSKPMSSGSNVFTGSVNYAEGVQPLDSEGNNYLSPYPAGIINATNLSINAVYPVFFGSIESSEDIDDVNLSSLTKSIVVSTGTVSVNFASIVGKKLVVAIPFESATKTIWYKNALNSGGIGNTGDLFPTVEVKTYNSPTSLWAGKSYKVYISTVTTTSEVMEFRN